MGSTSIKTLIEVHRRTEHADRCAFDTHHYISSAPLDIARLAKVVRGHWGVESMHWLFESMLTPAQCRAARPLLDWPQQQLADAARVGVVTVRQLEAGASQPRNATLDVMKRALEAAGVIFLAKGATIDGGPGVRLRSK